MRLHAVPQCFEARASTRTTLLRVFSRQRNPPRSPLAQSLPPPLDGSRSSSQDAMDFLDGPPDDGVPVGSLEEPAMRHMPQPTTPAEQLGSLGRQRHVTLIILVCSTRAPPSLLRRPAPSPACSRLTGPRPALALALLLQEPHDRAHGAVARRDPARACARGDGGGGQVGDVGTSRARFASPAERGGGGRTRRRLLGEWFGPSRGPF